MKLYKEAHTEITNSVLFEEFKRISQHDNPFDCITALKKFKKKYKTSIFYKETHLNIYKAYELYTKTAGASLLIQLNELLQYDNLALYLNDMLNSLDTSILINKFLDGIDYGMLLDTLKNLIPEITIDDLNTITEKLQKAVTDFKK